MIPQSPAPTQDFNYEKPKRQVVVPKGPKQIHGVKHTREEQEPLRDQRSSHVVPQPPRRVKHRHTARGE
jgi:hypothetical protein